MGVWTGWMTPFNNRIVLVAEPGQDAEEARTQLVRIGYDRVLGVVRDVAAETPGAERFDTAPMARFVAAYRSGEAAQVLERAVSISSNTAATRFLLGEAYRDDNRLERAKEAYRDAVVIDADFGPAWAGLAAVLARTGPRDEFEAAMKQLTRLEPELARQFLESSRSPRN